MKITLKLPEFPHTHHTARTSDGTYSVILSSSEGTKGKFSYTIIAISNGDVIHLNEPMKERRFRSRMATGFRPRQYPPSSRRLRQEKIIRALIRSGAAELVEE
jgi:hypothetical protein